jgi:hypothetical protein
VWPHDTALCAAGFARYGNKQAAAHWLDELFRAASHFGMRMPELPLRLRAPFPASRDRVSRRVPAPGLVARGGVQVLQACLGFPIDACTHTKCARPAHAAARAPRLSRAQARRTARRASISSSSARRSRVVASAELRAPDDCAGDDVLALEPSRRI